MERVCFLYCFKFEEEINIYYLYFPVLCSVHSGNRQSKFGIPLYGPSTVHRCLHTQYVT